GPRARRPASAQPSPRPAGRPGPSPRTASGPGPADPGPTRTPARNAPEPSAWADGRKAAPRRKSERGQTMRPAPFEFVGGILLAGSAKSLLKVRGADCEAWDR